MIMVPAISTDVEVSKAIEFFYVTPYRTRGYSPYSYTAVCSRKYALPEQSKHCLQLESRAALENIHICDKPEYINSVFVGRYDLANSWGLVINSISCIELLIEAGGKLRAYGLKVGKGCLNQSGYNQLSHC